MKKAGNNSKRSKLRIKRKKSAGRFLYNAAVVAVLLLGLISFSVVDENCSAAAGTEPAIHIYGESFNKNLANFRFFSREKQINVAQIRFFAEKAEQVMNKIIP